MGHKEFSNFLWIIPIVLLVGFSVNTAYAVPIDANYLTSNNYTDFRLGNSIIDSHKFINGEHTVTTTLGVPERFEERLWVWTNSTIDDVIIPNGHFESNWDNPYFVNEQPDTIKVETKQGSYVYNKDACALTFYNGELLVQNSNSTIDSDSYLMYGAVMGTSNWVEVPNLNDAVCQTTLIENNGTIEIWGTKEVPGNAKVVFKWIKHPDEQLKIQIEPTNLNLLWNNHKVGIKQTIHIPDDVKLGDTEYHIPDFNGTTVDRTWIADHKAEIIELGEGLTYDVGLGWQFLEDIDIVYEGNQSKLVFNYFNGENLILPNQTLIIDPTYGYVTGIFSTVSTWPDTATTECEYDTYPRHGSHPQDYDNGYSTGIVTLFESISSAECTKSSAEFDTTAIPDSAVVTQVDFRFDIVTPFETPITCDFRPLQFQPSLYGTTSADLQQLWNDIGNGTDYTSGNTDCQTVANNYVVTLGGTSVTDLDNLLTQDWFGIGLNFNTDVRDATTRYTTFETPELQVTFILSEPKPEYSTSFIYDETLAQYNLTLASPDSLYDDYDTLGQTILKNEFYPPYSITVEPISHITFDDTGDTNPKDIGGRDGTATTTGALDYRASPLGHGAYFDGINDYVTLSDEADFDFIDFNSPFSVSYWVSGEISQFGDILITKKNTSGSADAGWWITRTSLGNNIFYMRNGTDIFNSNAASSTSPEWQHLVFTNDGSGNRNKVLAYLDGVLDGTPGSLVMEGSMQNALSVTIADVSNHNKKGNQTIDDVRFYDYKLSATQIADLYNYEYQNKYTYPAETDLGGTANLVASWNFDNTLHDDSRNGNELLVGTGSTLYTNSTYGRGWYGDGVNTLVNSTKTTNFDFNNTDDFSIATVVTVASGWATLDTIIGKDSNINNGASKGFALALQTGDQFSFRLQDGTAYGVSSTETFVVGRPVSVIVTYSGSTDADQDEMRIYINGTLDGTGATSTISNDFIDTDVALSIGGNDIGNARWFDGNIDYIKVYDDVLSQSEIWAISNMTNYSESNTISFTDSNTSPPFSANYTGVTITSLGSSADNTNVYSAPAPNDPVGSSVSTPAATSSITLTVDTPPGSAGTIHGYYVDILNNTDSKYYNVDLFGANYVPLPLIHWKFDGKETGMTNYGTLPLNNLEVIGDHSYRNSTVGSGFNFIDDSTKLQLDTTTLFGNSGGDDSAFTVMAWIQPDDAGVFRIFNTCNPDPNVISNSALGIELTIGGGNKLGFNIFDQTTSNIISANGATSLNIDQLYHVVGVYNGNGTASGMSTYIDGVDDTLSTPETGTYTETWDKATQIQIGSRCNSSQNNGMVDELKYFDLELTPAQIASEYAVTSPQIDNNPYEQELLHMKFDSTTYDSAHGYNGITTGTQTFDTGKLGNGFSFNGASGVFNYDESAFDFDVDDDLSIALWTNATDTATADHIVAKFNGAGYILFKQTTDRISLYINDGANIAQCTTTNVLTFGSFTHIAVSYTGNETISSCSNFKIYLDGASETLSYANVGIVNSTILNDSLLTIGKHSDSPANYFIGVVDDIRIFSTNITSAQVTELYNSGSGTQSPLGVTIDPTPSVTVSDLTVDTEYTFKVYPVNGAGQSGDSFVYSQFTISPPTNLLTDTISTTQINLNWTASSGTVVGYKIERESPVGNGFSTIVANTSNTNISYNDTGLSSATQYNYRVSTLNAGGESTPSNEAYNWTQPDAPISPSAIPATSSPFPLAHHPASAYKINLEWTAPSGTITGYLIERTNSTGTGWDVIQTNYVGGTFYNDTGLLEQTTYIYRIASITNPTGPYSPSFNATTGDGPDPPLNVTATIIDPDLVPLDILVSWEYPLDIGDNTVITGYDILRSVNGGVYTSLINDTAGLTYNDLAVVSDTNYTYAIGSKGDVIDGNFSSTPLPLMLPVLNAQDPLGDMNQLTPYMKEYDILIYDSANHTILSPSFPPTLHGTGGPDHTTLLAGLCNVPADTTVISYNYEPSVTPGYSSNETIAAGYFSDLKDEANSCGKLLLVTPVFIYTSHWNWTYISQFTDIINLQVQNFQQGANFDILPPGSSPEELGIDMAFVVKYMVAAVPDPTPLYIQLDTLGPSAPQLTDDFKLVERLGVDGVTIWYNPTQSNTTAILQPLLDTLDVIRDSPSLVRNENNTIMTPTIPDAPTAVTPTIPLPDSQPYQISVNITDGYDGGSNVTGYTIWRSTDDITFVNVTATINNPYLDTVPSVPNQIYYYKVNAKNLIGYGANSTSANITVNSAPDAPTGVTPTIPLPDTLPYQINVSWTPPVDDGGSNVTGYTLWRSVDDITFVNVTATSHPTTSFLDTTVPSTSNQTYYYKVNAKSLLGYGVNSTSANITTPDVPDAPTGVIAVVALPDITPFKIDITWTGPVDDGGSNVTAYTVYQSTDNITYVNATQVPDFPFPAIPGGLTVPSTPGQIYYYKISALNGVGYGTNSTAVSVTVPDVPDAPTAVTPTIPLPDTLPYQINVSWTTPAGDGGSNVTGYTLWRSVDDITFINVTATSHPTTSFLDTTVPDPSDPNQIYYYKVSATNIPGYGANSTSASINVADVPDAPTAVTPTIPLPDSQPYQINVSWISPVGDGGSAVTAHTLWRSTDDVIFVNVTTTSMPTVTYLDTVPSVPGQIYYYKASATNIPGYGVNSTSASITTPTVPNAPTAVTPTIPLPDSQPYQINVAWTPPAGDGGSAITDYTVWRSLDDITFVNVTETGSSPYLDTVPSVPSTTYYYKVNAKNLIGYGVNSTSASIATLDVPDAPTGLTALPRLGATSMQLSWTAPGNDGGSAITGYQIQRNIDNAGWITIVTTTGTPATTYVNTGLSLSTNYKYGVHAINLIGAGIASNTAESEFTTAVLSPMVTVLTGNAIKFDLDVNMTYGIPDSEIYDVELKLWGTNHVVTQVSPPPSIVVAKGGAANFTLYDNIQELTEYYMAVKTKNGVTGEFIEFETGKLSAFPSLVYDDRLIGVEYRNSNFTESNLQIVASQTYYDLVVVYREFNNLDNEIVLTWEDVINDAISVTSVDPTKKYYVSGYYQPTFDYTIGGTPIDGTATIPAGYPVDISLVSIPDPNQVGFTLGIDVIAGESGIFGLPLVFIFIIALASVFTGRSAPMGIIFIAVALGFMAYMGLVDFNFDPANDSNTATWAIIIVAVIIGVMVGKRWD